MILGCSNCKDAIITYFSVLDRLLTPFNVLHRGHRPQVGAMLFIVAQSCVQSYGCCVGTEQTAATEGEALYELAQLNNILQAVQFFLVDVCLVARSTIQDAGQDVSFFYKKLMWFVVL